MTRDSRRARRLPDDQAFWDGLAERAIERAFADTARHTSDPLAALGGSGWWTPVSDAAHLLAAAAVVALAALFLLPDRGPAPSSDEAISRALYPADPLLQSLLAPNEPPPASALMSLIALKEGRR